MPRLLLLAALVAVLAAPALARPHLAKRGQATYYDAGGIGACGFPIGDGACALSGADFDPSTPNGNPNANTLCGQTITVTSGGNSVSCVISDRCEGCAAGDVDLQAGQFAQLAPLGAGRIEASWSFAGSAPAPAPAPAPVAAPIEAPAAPTDSYTPQAPTNPAPTDNSAPIDPAPIEPASSGWRWHPEFSTDPATAPSSDPAPSIDYAPSQSKSQGCDPGCGTGVHWATGSCVSGTCVCIVGWMGPACDVPDVNWASA